MLWFSPGLLYRTTATGEKGRDAATPALLLIRNRRRYLVLQAAARSAASRTGPAVLGDSRNTAPLCGHLSGDLSRRVGEASLPRRPGKSKDAPQLLCDGFRRLQPLGMRTLYDVAGAAAWRYVRAAAPLAFPPIRSRLVSSTFPSSAEGQSQHDGEQWLMTKGRANARPFRFDRCHPDSDR